MGFFLFYQSQGGMEMDKLTITNVADMQPVDRIKDGDFGFRRHELVPGDGSHPSNVRVYWLPPGKSNYPYHWHETHEEVFYIISGSGIVKTEEGDKPLRPGDVLVCPTNLQGAHMITNPSETEDLVYLEFDTISFPEVAHYPLVNGLGVLFPGRVENQFFIDGKRVPYDDLGKDR